MFQYSFDNGASLVASDSESSEKFDMAVIRNGRVACSVKIVFFSKTLN